jgi:hypothetical protein
VAEGKKSPEGLGLDSRLQELNSQLGKLQVLKGQLNSRIEGFLKGKFGLTASNADLISDSLSSEMKSVLTNMTVAARAEYDFSAVGYQKCIAEITKLEKQRSELVVAIAAQPAKDKAFLDAKIVDYAQLYTSESLSKIQANVKAARARGKSSTKVAAALKSSSGITVPTRYWFNPLRWIGY